MSGVADIDVEPTVAVDVRHDDAGAPLLFGGGEPCLFRNVLKMPVAFVEIELIGPHIGGEEYVGEAVVVDVADGYAAAIVEVAIVDNVGGIGVDYFIDEIDAGVGHPLE